MKTTLIILLITLLFCANLPNGANGAKPKKIKKWCDLDLAKKVLEKYYVIPGMGHPQGNFTGVYPYIAENAHLQAVSANLLPGRNVIIPTLDTYHLMKQYTTLSLDVPSTIFSTIYNPDQCVCGAVAMVNRTLVHPPTIKPIWTFPSVVEIEPVFHQWREKTPCTGFPNKEDKKDASKSKLCMEIFLIQEHPNSGSLFSFFEPVLSWNVSQMCDAVSEICDPLNANPFITHDQCMAYGQTIPQYAPTPGDNPTRPNVVGNSVMCRSFNIAGAYATSLVGNIPELQTICASTGPDGAPGATCSVYSTPFMDPQRETYLAPACRQ